ncbi:MAG TPA: hypothetical protein VGW74_21485 [Propionibacteriaceae bacterium]|nr:hypothetical protein [Propionibacteriaceae bacterium]
MTDALQLDELGYAGDVDESGYVVPAVGDYTWHARAKLSEAVADLLAGLGGDQPRYFVQTSVKNAVDRAWYLATLTELEGTLSLAGVTDVPPGAVCGARRLGEVTVSWGDVPPPEQLTVLPTATAVREYPEFWLTGPGRAVAGRVDCGHGYYLTATCPNCGADQGPALRRATPEQRQALLDAVVGPTPEERRRDALKAAVEMAHAEAQTELQDVQRAFAVDVTQLGPVRATSLWARKAMAWETKVSVWGLGVDLGNTGGDWSAAVDASEQMAVRLLKESVTPTRNAVDKALREVQGRTAAELLDTIESFRKSCDR